VFGLDWFNQSSFTAPASLLEATLGFQTLNNGQSGSDQLSTFTLNLLNASQLLASIF